MGKLDNFIPAIWSGNILQTLNNALVYAQMGVVNTDYQGLIQAMGDRVKINSVSRVTVKSYTKNQTLDAPERLTSAQQELLIDQADYYHFGVDDVDMAQMNVNMMSQSTQDSGYEMAAAADANVATEMAANVPSGNQIGTQAAPKTDLDTVTYGYKYLLQLKTKLDESNTPRAGRWVIIPPWFEEVMLQDARFVQSGTPIGDQRLMNGQVARVAGFNILTSNEVPNTSGTKYKIIAGHALATSYADQIIDTEAYRIPDGFGTAVKGLHVYGRKVIRPNNLAMIVANRPS